MKLPTAELWGISCLRLLRLHLPWLVPTAAELRVITIEIKRQAIIDDNPGTENEWKYPIVAIDRL